MTDTIDELGPVDYIVVEFPGNKFNGEIDPVLAAILIDRNIVKSARPRLHHEGR